MTEHLRLQQMAVAVVALGITSITYFINGWIGLSQSGWAGQIGLRPVAVLGDGYWFQLCFPAMVMPFVVGMLVIMTLRVARRDDRPVVATNPWL